MENFLSLSLSIFTSHFTNGSLLPHLCPPSFPSRPGGGRGLRGGVGGYWWRWSCLAVSQGAVPPHSNWGRRWRANEREKKREWERVPNPSLEGRTDTTKDRVRSKAFWRLGPRQLRQYFLAPVRLSNKAELEYELSLTAVIRLINQI